MVDRVLRRRSRDKPPKAQLAGVRAALIANALRTTRSTYRRARITRFVIHTIATIAIPQGARKAIATPIIRKLHVIAPADCASVRRSVVSGPLSWETILPGL